MKDINKILENFEEQYQFNFTFKQNRRISAICCNVLVIIFLLIFLCTSFVYVFMPFENNRIYYLISILSIFGTYWLPYLLHYIFLKKYFNEFKKSIHEQQILLSENFKSNCYDFMMESTDHIVYICSTILYLVFIVIYLTKDFP